MTLLIVGNRSKGNHMPRGGARPGAGRPKGAMNKASAAREAEIKASGLTPLQYMLNILRDETASKQDRMWAAEKAAAFVHPRLAQQQFKGPDGGKIMVQIVRFTDPEEEAAGGEQRGTDEHEVEDAATVVPFVALAHATEQD